MNHHGFVASRSDFLCCIFNRVRRQKTIHSFIIYLPDHIFPSVRPCEAAGSSNCIGSRHGVWETTQLCHATLLVAVGRAYAFPKRAHCSHMKACTLLMIMASGFSFSHLSSLLRLFLLRLYSFLFFSSFIVFPSSFCSTLDSTQHSYPSENLGFFLQEGGGGQSARGSPSIAEVRNAWRFFTFLHSSSWRGA